MPNDTTGRYSALTRTDGSAALRSLEPWLPTLQPGQRVPADKVPLIRAALDHVTRSLMPASPQQIAIEVDALMDWAQAFNVPVKDIGALTKAYLEGLKNLPADLLPIAMERARVFHVWGQRMPLPSEILKHVKDELECRQVHRGKLILASRLQSDQPSAGKRWDEMTPNEQAAFDARMKDFYARFPTQRATC